MRLKDFDTVITILKQVYETLDYSDIESVNAMVKENDVADTFFEMMEEGLIKERQKKNDYFIPWHKNLYGDVTVDSFRKILVNKELEKDEEFVKLTNKEIQLRAELSEVLKKIGEKQDEYAYIYSPIKSPSLDKKEESVFGQKAKEEKEGKSIAEQIRSLKVIDGKTEEDLLVERINGHPLTANPIYDYVEAGMF